MADVKDILVPDIGDFEGVEVIEIMVSAGDTISVEDPLVSLESDKAAIEVPSPQAGTIKEVKVSMGDNVSQGDLLVTMEVSETEAAPAAAGGGKPYAVRGCGRWCQPPARIVLFTWWLRWTQRPLVAGPAACCCPV